jgi:hypothetical protein
VSAAAITADVLIEQVAQDHFAAYHTDQFDFGGGQIDDHYPHYPVQVWRLGDQEWISLGGETLVDYAERFRAEYGEGTWVTSYSADLIAYIPSRRNIIEGLYEGTNLYEYMHPADRWALDTEDRIAAVVGRLMKQVREAP